MSSRLLIIASYNGPRHHTDISPTRMLEIQWTRLYEGLHHQMDVVVMAQEFEDDQDYTRALHRFPDVMYTNNEQGSYGAWRDGYLSVSKLTPDHEWYLFIEDDYTFFEENFDQKWIDMWEPGMSYLAHRIGGGNHPKHASCAAGLTTREILEKVDWSILRAEQEYDSALQLQWSQLFDARGLADITTKYDSPFWNGREILRTDPTKPMLIGPMQAL